MQTHFSPSVGWAMWGKQTQMPPRDRNVTFIQRREKYICPEELKIRRQQLSSDQPHSLGRRCGFWAPDLGGSFESVKESVELLLQLGDYKSLRFLVEDVTVNNYKRTCHWHEEKGEETLVEPQWCAKRFAKCFMHIISFNSDSFLMIRSSSFFRTSITVAK